MLPCPRKFLLTTLCLLLSFSPGFANTKAQFQPGDHFVYDLYWSFIKVGQAELNFTQSTPETPPVDHLLATFSVKTSGVADKLFKVRDRIESWIDPLTERPSVYKKKQREGKTKRDIELGFDWENLEATYTRNGKVYAPMPITEHTFDPLSLITRLAQNDFSLNNQFKQATTDGKEVVYILASLKESTKIKVKAGRFEAYRIEVATNELEGVFEKTPDAAIEIWLSKDAPAIPLKMKSEVAVGSFYGELRGGTYQGKPIKQ